MKKSRDPKELGGPERAVRAMDEVEKYAGALPGFRRAHARGIVLRGHFVATPEAAALTTAEHMQGEPIATIVRLSNGAPGPYAPDRKAVLGLAVRFELPSGGSSSWAALSMEAAPFGTPDDFIDLQGAQRRNKAGKPNPLRLLKHIVTHFDTLPGLLAVLKAPSTQSFGCSRFNGLTAYWLVDGEGRRRAFRYRWIPSEKAAGLTPEQEREYPPDYLLSEIEQRVGAGPVSWTLVFQMADPRDPVDDVTKQWPEKRTFVTAGRLVIDRLHEDPEAADDLVFDPTSVPPGIELSDDPILHFRSEAYKESHRRRASETKPPVRPG